MRLVVVGARPAVVPQVDRGLDRLGAARVLGAVLRGTPVGVHVVHGSALSVRVVIGGVGVPRWPKSPRTGPERHGSRDDALRLRGGGSRLQERPSRASSAIRKALRGSTGRSTPNTAARWP